MPIENVGFSVGNGSALACSRTADSSQDQKWWRYVVFQLAEMMLPRGLLAENLRRINRLGPKPFAT